MLLLSELLISFEPSIACHQSHIDCEELFDIENRYRTLVGRPLDLIAYQRARARAGNLTPDSLERSDPTNKPDLLDSLVSSGEVQASFKMSSYYDEDDELDIRIHRGRASPQPVIYPEHRRPARPVYYHHGSSYLEPQYSSGNLHRSRSTGHRQSPPPPPVIINKIYNEERYEDEDDRSAYLQLAPRPRARSRSRSRAPSFTSSSRHSSRDEYELEKARKEYELEKTRKEYELEKTRKELEHFKLKADREDEAKRLKKELELERLRKEREEEEEKRRAKKEADEAVEKWKRKEAERIQREKREEEEAIEKYKRKEAERVEKEKKEKEEREKEYQHRLEDDLRKAGMDDRQIAVVTKKEKAIDPNRPTFTRMSRRHLSIETLNAYKIDYEFDVVNSNSGKTGLRTRTNKVQDPNYVLIRRWVPEYEQDFLWNHTREIRERRQPVLVAIEGKKKHGDVEFEFVRKKEHKRKTSPSPLLTFLAGGKR